MSSLNILPDSSGCQLMNRYIVTCVAHPNTQLFAAYALQPKPQHGHFYLAQGTAHSSCEGYKKEESRQQGKEGVCYRMGPKPSNDPVAPAEQILQPHCSAIKQQPQFSCHH